MTAPGALPEDPSLKMKEDNIIFYLMYSMLKSLAKYDILTPFQRKFTIIFFFHDNFFSCHSTQRPFHDKVDSSRENLALNKKCKIFMVKAHFHDSLSSYRERFFFIVNIKINPWGLIYFIKLTFYRLPEVNTGRMCF